MDMYEACKELVNDIKKDIFCDDAILIQFFYEELQKGETPRMALSLARKDTIKFVESVLMSEEQR